MSAHSKRLFLRPACSLLVFLLAGLLVGQGSLQEYVLCLGPDGHVAVESATGPGESCRSAPAPQERRIAPTDFLVSGLYRSACQDLLIAFGLFYVRPIPSLLRIAPSASPFLSSDPAFWTALETPPSASPFRLVPSFFVLSSLRTTILLI